MRPHPAHPTILDHLVQSGVIVRARKPPFSACQTCLGRSSVSLGVYLFEETIFCIKHLLERLERHRIVWEGHQFPFDNFQWVIYGEPFLSL